MTTTPQISPDEPHPLPFKGKTPSVTERVDGRWEIRVTVVPNTKPRPFYGKTRAAVIEKWNRWLYVPESASVSPAIYLPSGQVVKRPDSVAELVKTYLKNGAEQLAIRSYETYRDQWDDHLLTVFGHLKIEDVSRAMVVTYIHELLRSNMPTTSLARRKTALSRPFAYALEMGWITSNPTRDIKTPTPARGVRTKATRTDEPKEFWIPTLEEVNHFLKVNAGDDLYNLWLVGFTLGPRPGEICGFAEDCLLGKGVADQVSIHRQVFRERIPGRPWVTTLPKDNSQRVLDAPTEAINALIDQIAISRAATAANPNWPKEWHGYLWRTRKGEPIDPANLNQMFAVRCRKAGWDKPNPAHPDDPQKTLTPPVYTLRHFCLSSLCYSTDPIVPLALAADWAGHKDGGITLAKSYLHRPRRTDDQKIEKGVFQGRIGSDYGQDSGQPPKPTP